ncbi:NnrU family protein [Frigidibacter oleivorans]|uniref:NnrU family protein n=1 Tax=Frigidibacter oleivorans TaxID=2487129 RepID=UPI000F8E848F|nr:NnrU family protein [Frigidibacter oleivorans]
MTLLILGVILWSAAHLFKRVAPGARAALGDRGKGLIAFLLLLSVVLMVIGYRGAEFRPVYTPIPGMGHLNNLLMLVSVFLFGVGGTKGTLYTRMRHPMLVGTLIWSAAHLLVNGDLASLILFGGIAVWALAEIALINRTPWNRPLQGRGPKGDAMNLAGTVLLYALIAGVHIWTGHNPFTGTYG